MPGFLTHYLAGQAVLAQSETPIDADRERIFNLGTQGADIFFYYVPGHIRPRTRGIGSDIHRADCGLFFMQMTRLLKHVPEEERDALFAYLAGFLVHYTIDATAHPFVYAHTQREGATALQDSAEHRHFETAVDVLMLARLTGKCPAEYKQWKLIEAPARHKQIAAAAFSAAAQRIYGKRVLPQDVYNAMWHFTQLTHLLHSPSGRRKRLTARLESATLGVPIFSAMVHMQEITDERDYLNLSRAHWNNSTASFPELFDAGVAEAVRMVNGLREYMNGDIHYQALAQIIGNRSLTTGEEC